MNANELTVLRRILVVDDNPSIHSDFQKILVGHPANVGQLKRAAAGLFGTAVVPEKLTVFELHSALQGQEGLRAVQEAVQSGRPFEMAFIDVRMPPGWDGIETITRLWKVDPDLQVVVCTAYSDYDLNEMIAKLGMTDKFVVLKKPFDMIEVLQLANACTEKWRLLRQLRGQARLLRESDESLRQAQASLEERVRDRTEELRKLSQAVEQSPVAVVITDCSGLIEYVNPQFTRATGYGAEEAIGRKPSLLKSGLTPPEVYRDLWNTLNRREVWHGEFCNRRKNGELHWENASIAPLLSTEGKVTHYIAVKMDTTDQKRGEQVLQEMNEQLGLATARANEMAARAELASGAKSRFLANMSHEIRTPMNGVIGMTELLLGTELSPEQRQLTTVARNSGRALLSIINDILDFSKIEAGKMQLESIDFDLRTTLEDAGEVVGVKAAEKGLQVICLVDPEVPLALRGDPGRLRQILLNLAGNAVKFTSQGEVVLRASLETQDERWAIVRFAVTDTGSGIPPDRQHLLFSSFVQLDGSNTRRSGGTGLGLAISKQLAELMGGRIGIESVPGRGSTFWFTARMEKASPAAAEPEVPKVASAGLRVLVVEQHPLARLAIAQALQALGCDFAEAPDPRAALELLARSAVEGYPFRLALLDARTLDREVLTLGHTIKRDSAIAPTCLVLMTALGQGGNAGELATAGFDGFLSKPVRLAQLGECLSLHGTDGARSSGKAAPYALPALGSPRKPGARILVADDSPANRLVAVKFVEKLGYHADSVASGPEALEALRKVAYDLVLMDCQMPELDGFETTRSIRSGDAAVLNRAVPIIALTACALNGDREACCAAGMDDYLTKPVDYAELAGALDRCLRKAARREEVAPILEPLPPPPQTEARPLQSAAGRPASADPPLFDCAGFVRRLMGDLEMADLVAQSFLADMPGQIQALKAAVDSADAAAATKVAHRMKGASSAVGGSGLQRLAYSMELAGKSQDLGTLHAILPELVEEFEGLRQLLEKKPWQSN